MTHDVAGAARLDGCSAADGSIARKFLDMTRDAWTHYWTRRARSATVAVLQTLDDRALKDIGLDRSEIESVVYGECDRHGARVAERRLGMCH